MDKSLHPLYSYIRDEATFLKRCSRCSWSLGMAKWFHPTFYWTRAYLSMLGLKLIHISKMGPWPHCLHCSQRVAGENRFTWSTCVDYCGEKKGTESLGNWLSIPDNILICADRKWHKGLNDNKSAMVQVMARSRRQAITRANADPVHICGIYAAHYLSCTIIFRF